MARKRHSPEQVINKIREAEVAIAEGGTVAEAARRIGVTEQTFYRWRSEYGGLRSDQARRLKRLMRFIRNSESRLTSVSNSPNRVRRLICPPRTCVAGEPDHIGTTLTLQLEYRPVNA